MPWDIRNNWPDIAHARTSDEVTDSSFSTQTALRLELYTGTHELELENYTVTIGFSRMTLKVDCDGTEIAIGKRYGDSVAVNEIVTEETSKTGTSARASASAQTSMGFSATNLSVDAKAQAEVEAEKSIVRTHETTTQRVARYVTAQPNDKWMISSLNGSALNHKFLTHSDELCTISPKPKSNRTAVKVHLSGHKRDLVFDPSEFPKARYAMFGAGNCNKEKIFKVLAAKVLIGEREDLAKSTSVQLTVMSSYSDDEI